MKLRDKVILVPTSDLVPYHSNARNHSKEQIDKLASIIAEYGFDQPIVIDENNVIIKGHGRHQALLKLNWKEAPCIRIEGLTESQKRAMRVSDNILHDISNWDEDLLKEELLKLKDDGVNVDFISDFQLKKDSILPSSYDEKEYDENIKTEHKCPKCDYEW